MVFEVGDEEMDWNEAGDEGYDEAEETLDELSLEEEEVYDDSVGPDVEVEDEDDFWSFIF